MTSYLEQIEKSCNDNSCNPKPHGKRSQVISRRSFLQSAYAGAAAMAVGFGSAEEAQAKLRGLITLDAILITYFSASVGGTDTPTWALKGAYSNTLRLSLAALPEVVLKPKMSAVNRTVFAGHRIEQARSEEVADAIILRHKGLGGTSFGFGTFGVPATSEDTRFFCITRPQLQIIVSSASIFFQLRGGEAIYSPSVKELKEGDPFGLIGPETAASWLPLYVTDKAALVEPRFELKKSTGQVSAGVEIPVNLSENGDKRFLSQKTAITTAGIVEQSGFSPADPLTELFAVGNRLNITHTAIQEVKGKKVVRMETAITRAATGETKVYWDSLFKTFVIIDAGVSQ